MIYCQPTMYFIERVRLTVPKRPLRLLSYDDISSVVCAHFNVYKRGLIGATRMRTYTDARHMGMYLMKKFVLKATVNTIGEYFGRDHSTVSVSMAKVEDLTDTDKKFREHYNKLFTKLMIMEGRANDN
ncbi:helix-turn-helix domain-containing protein [Mucilaginibacter glaciei]|uniref:Chromosomal replication initiator DnaA C-terminal domain-containing protein n=1 Tax=Mucilaginibacter glaciei TaxID=2772109 RepID=A0A926NUK5_9SPHI|nr:helix-turn-helix domain-containing protein [Mucilaginibacter glaciei]MBD1394290.1 hypothetical protein [Mucilaginibacter glaciei]